MPGFEDLGLDPRLLRALAKRNFTKPTSVQQEAIPRTLEGKDIVARARTGSGKTLAYLLPALHRVLLASARAPVSGSAADANSSGHNFQALILVPTRELCDQVRQEAADIAALCGSVISVTALVADVGPQLKRAVATAGQLVVSTPGRIAKALQDGALPATALTSRLQMLVLDEADLLLSYGFEADLALIAPQIPRACQCMLMSATISPEVERLTQMVLHNPVTLNLMAAGSSAAGGADDAGQGAGSGMPSTIEHFFYDCATSMDRLLVIMAMLRLGLVRKKTLTFVNTVDQGYRVKLYLESFGVRAALLNAELPLNSRSHILQSFNRGLFDHLIATDDVHASSHDAAPSTSKSNKGRKQQTKEGKGQKAKGAQKDEEFGVTRGIDFKGVHTVINFDLPSTVEGYVHRVGRTGRAGRSGIAITLVTAADVGFRSKLECLLNPSKAAAVVVAAEAAAAAAAEGGKAIVSNKDEELLAASSGGTDSDSSDDEEGQDKEAKKKSLRPFSRLSKAQVESLRYRGEDVARSITRNTIKEARLKELKAELLNSARLKDYFEDHAAERQLLRHDKPLHKTPQAPHLRHLPAYLKDPNLVKAKSSTGNNSEGQPMLPHRKARKLAPPPEASIQGTTSESFASGQDDPLKSVKGFARAPKKRGHHDEELTEMEKRATEAGLKEARKKAKQEGNIPQLQAASRAKTTARRFKRKR